MLEMVLHRDTLHKHPEAPWVTTVTSVFPDLIMSFVSYPFSQPLSVRGLPWVGPGLRLGDGVLGKHPAHPCT